MNKLVLSIIVVTVIAISLGTAGFAYAQASTPQTSVSGTGYGMGGGRGAGRGMMQSANDTQDGLLHDAMIAIYAEKLGISVDDINTRLSGGETLAQIALSKGMSVDQFRTFMADSRSQAIDQAEKDGTLTQTQANWMAQRGAGMANGGRGMRGTGQGQFANPDCPYSQTTP